ncbi:hypothetical protein [Catellatospora tritici]|uniref:hypothetical protein n=1 Tax=Catellatospora tritici TaxID=2851566 RepID=UPI001C2D99C0|nr:hypothetical protein [Catellatospora tritici]MBV1856631.1 hypothetical protein [Catellatospora tritici]
MKQRLFMPALRVARTGGLAVTLVAVLGLTSAAASAAYPSRAAPTSTMANGRVTVSAASLVTVVCPGSDDVTFSPGLRNFSQTVSFSETLEGHACTGLGKIPGDNSFATSFSGTTQLSCTTLHASGMFTLVFTWSPSGRTSTWSAALGEVAYVNGQVVATATGPITAGDYTGSTLTSVSVYPTAQLAACLSAPGLTHLHGTVTWTVAGL